MNIDRDLEMAASLMGEAAKLLGTVDPEVLEKLPDFRWPLCDELSGAAGILRDRLTSQVTAEAHGDAVGMARWPLTKYDQRQRKWCAHYESMTGFEPLMCDFEAGNQSFVEAAKLSVDWYESHTGDMFLAITRRPIPGSEYDMGDDHE